jgi:hypothetical protein
LFVCADSVIWVALSGLTGVVVEWREACSCCISAGLGLAGTTDRWSRQKARLVPTQWHGRQCALLYSRNSVQRSVEVNCMLVTRQIAIKRSSGKLPLIELVSRGCILGHSSQPPSLWSIQLGEPRFRGLYSSRTTIQFISNGHRYARQSPSILIPGYC